MRLTPESRGIYSAELEKILRELDAAGVPIHSFFVARGFEVVFDAYWAPFNENTLHRMNSVTKSFVALGIGMLIDEGRINLSDKVIDYFPEIEREGLDASQLSLTVENLLTMRTGYRPIGNGHWVRDREYDRIRRFFSRTPQTEINDSFYYDSTGSYILGVIVERLTGGSFVKYIQHKCLDDLGFSTDADCIKGGEGYSWSDSGLLCTTKDLYRYARLLALGGEIDGVRYISEDFARDAVSSKASTEVNAEYKSYGYGYQIWKAKYDGFMFLGMGAQILIYIPKRDLYVACTADTQPDEKYREKIVDLMYELIDADYERCADSLPEDNAAYASLYEYKENLKLVSMPKCKMPEKYKDFTTSAYKCDENPMGITEFSFEFGDCSGIFRYTNAQGDKEIPFGFGHNEFSLFGEDGYFDMEIGVSPDGHRYPIATSAMWQSECELVITVQFIGRHLGGDIITVRFDSDTAVLKMKKTTNCFLDKYNGETVGTLK